MTPSFDPSDALVAPDDPWVGRQIDRSVSQFKGAGWLVLARTRRAFELRSRVPPLRPLRADAMFHIAFFRRGEHGRRFHLSLSGGIPAADRTATLSQCEIGRFVARAQEAVGRQFDPLARCMVSAAGIAFCMA
jgi:hypothetical protein